MELHDGSRSLQDRFDPRALADRIDDLLASDAVGDGDRAFVEERDGSSSRPPTG